MRLTITMLKWPDEAEPENREIDGAIAIGRVNCGWNLADKRVSRAHCRIAPLGNAWHVTDDSSNGTFLNQEVERIERGQSRELQDGDQIRIGPYVLEVRYGMPEAMQSHAGAAGAAARWDMPATPFGQPNASGPFNQPPAAGGGWGPAEPAPWQPGAAGSNPYQAGQYSNDSANSNFIGRPSADHSAAIHDPWQPPAAPAAALPVDWNAPPDPVPVPGARSNSVLPPDWDQPPLPAAATPSSLSQAAVVPVMTPVMAPEITPGELPSVAPTTPAPVLTAPAMAAPANTAYGVGVPDALLAAFLRAAGLTDLVVTDPPATMDRLGRILRAFVSGMRAVHASRSEVKREFRILGTMIRAEGNNPLKFSAGDNEAMTSLLTGRGAVEGAVVEVLDDIRMHELAMIAAMRDAVKGIMATLNPERAHHDAEEGGLGGLMPAHRKARAYDLLVTRHAQALAALDDDFDSIFGKAFARAYERVMMDAEAARK